MIMALKAAIFFKRKCPDDETRKENGNAHKMEKPK